MDLPADLAMGEWVLDSEQALVVERRAVAARWRATFRAFELAQREPWVLNGADSRLRGAEAVRLAESAVIAELAVRHTVSEGTVRAQAHTAGVLLERLPRVWARFEEGFVPEQNAAEAARLVDELPEQSWPEFDALIAEVAAVLTPAKFRLKARGVRERIHPTDADTRHAKARQNRRAWFEPDRDGMGWFGAYVAADVGYRAMARIDETASQLMKLPGEERTLNQVRADVFGDLILEGMTTEVSLALTIPVMTQLGQDGGPAVLDGVGPIPLELAQRLAGEAKSYVRVLTDPITCTVLNMEGRTRRIPKAMRRWLQYRDRTCAFPGCNRKAMHSDVDHTKDVQYLGITENGNLAHLCPKHHRLKHKTNWRYVQTPGSPAVTNVQWTSPLGYRITADPPPF